MTHASSIYENGDLVQLDSSFLLHQHTKKYEVKSKEDVDNKLVFWEDTNSLELILEKKSLKRFITHPVVSTYIDLKNLKQRRIFFWNFILFLIIFIGGFTFLISSRFLSDNPSGLSWHFIIGTCFSLISILLMIGREYFQYVYVDRTLINYCQKKLNWLDVALIVFSIITYVSLNLKNEDFFGNSFLLLTLVITILLAVIVLLLMLPLAYMPIHMMMFKDVFMTFFRFFLTFISIFVAFSISFCVIFGDNASRVKTDFETIDASNETSTEIKKEEDTFDNFANPWYAFVKIILMLSGEFSIDPYTIKNLGYLAFFFLFVLSTFILFNLIQGLTIDDIKKKREDANKLTLEYNATRFIETSKILFKNVYKRNE